MMDKRISERDNKLCKACVDSIRAHAANVGEGQPPVTCSDLDAFFGGRALTFDHGRYSFQITLSDGVLANTLEKQAQMAKQQKQVKLKPLQDNLAKIETDHANYVFECESKLLALAKEAAYQ